MFWLHIFRSVADKGVQSSNEPIFTRADNYSFTTNILQFGKLYTRMQHSFNKDFKI